MQHFIELAHDILCIDTGYGRPRLTAAYLVHAGGRGAFIDTGTYHSVPRLLQALDHGGVARADVDYVIPTHVHLDHAGGAGELMRMLPNARLVVHPRGAPHLIDPTRLIAGTSAVYGEAEYRRRFGEIVPVPAERVLEAPDGYALTLGSRRLEFIDSPGHARHHFCVYDAASLGFFTGDTFGISYREFDTAAGAFVFATTTPPQFDPDAWGHTLDRLLAYHPRRMYLTHFGCVQEIARLVADLRASIRAFAEMTLTEGGAEGGRAARLRERMLELLLQALRSHGCTLSRERMSELLALDVELNVQGLETWLERRRRRAAGA